MEDLLEPLPVIVDGVAFAPMPAAERDVFTHDFADVVRAKIVETPGLRALTPWVCALAPSDRRAPSSPSAFNRMVGVHASWLDGVPDWWLLRADVGRVLITPALAIGEPQRDGPGQWKMRAWLRTSAHARAIPMELSLWHHLTEWTRLSLEPQRHVVCRRAYFDAGNRALDRLGEALVRDLGGCH